MCHQLAILVARNSQSTKKDPIMALKLGINGFGRIGRMVFRAAVENFANDIEVVGIDAIVINRNQFSYETNAADS